MKELIIKKGEIVARGDGKIRNFFLGEEIKLEKGDARIINTTSLFFSTE